MTDPISAELERALFKRFWAWLGIVGTLIIAAVAAISVLVSQVLLQTAKSSSEDAANRELAALSNKIAAIDNSSVEAAQKAAVNQANSEASAIAAASTAKQAEESISKIVNLLETNKAVLNGVGQIQGIADLIAAKPEFARIVTDNLNLQSRLEFSIVNSPLQLQDVKLSCPNGTQLVSASCIGNDGHLQTAVGPQINGDWSVMCYRYGPSVMPVQATAICLKIK
jgi:hypothetical protein